jgi:hypothetical protein
MNATARNSHKNNPNKITSTSTRSVPEMLLELAYRLHANKVVGRRNSMQTTRSTAMR